MKNSTMIVIFVCFFILGCGIIKMGYDYQSNTMQYIGGGIIVLPWIIFLIIVKIKRNQLNKTYGKQK